MSKLTAGLVILVAMILSWLFYVYMGRRGDRFIKKFWEDMEK